MPDHSVGSRVAGILAELEAERAGISSEAGAELTEPSTPHDLEALRPMIEPYVGDLRRRFAGPANVRRAGLWSLLGDRKMRVLADEERKLRVEGLFELPLETRIARHPQEDAGRFKQLVAGGDPSSAHQAAFTAVGCVVAAPSLGEPPHLRMAENGR